MSTIISNNEQSVAQVMDWTSYANLASYTVSGVMLAGPAGGMLGLNMGLIDDSITHPYKGSAPYASIALATISGTLIGWIPGGALGFTAALIDEFLITHQQSTKHYVSMITFHASMTFATWATILINAAPISYKLPIQIASLSLSIAATHYTDDFIDFYNKIEVPLDSFLTLNSAFDEKEVFSKKEIVRIYNKFLTNPVDALIAIQEDASNIYNNPFLLNFGVSGALSLSELAINYIYVSYLGIYSSGLFIPIFLTQSYQYKESPLTLPIIALEFDAFGIIGIHALQLYANMQITTGKNSVSNEYNRIIVEKASSMLLDKGNSRKVLSINEKEGKQSIEYLTMDLYTLLGGANKLIKVGTDSFGVMIGLANLIKYAPDILLPYMIVSLIPRQKFLRDIIPESKEIAEESADALMQARSFFGDIKNRSEEIDLRDGGDYVKHKFNLEWQRVKKSDLKSSAIENSKTNMYNAIDIHDHIVDILYYVTKYSLGILDLDKIPLIYNASDVVSDFLSSNLESQTDNIEIEIAKIRVTNFIKWSKTLQNNANKVDNIEGNIVFDDYSLYLKDKLLVHIDHLELEQGKHYVFTGQKGCGKSTTLTDLKEGVIGVFSSTGTIEYPFYQSIIFLNQKLYMPDSSTSTLLETLCFPIILDKLNSSEQLKLKELSIKLLKALGIEKFIPLLDSKEYKSSGGELKTFGFIQAIIGASKHLVLDESLNKDKYNILILDESLNELDSLSVFKTLEAMSEYLKNTTIILVTHNAHNQNYKHFFYKEVHFENSTITENYIDETPLTLEMVNYINSKSQSEFIPYEDFVLG